jgi:hypothetical protein
MKCFPKFGSFYFEVPDLNLEESSQVETEARRSGRRVCDPVKLAAITAHELFAASIFGCPF